jgi:hypothetical protein
VDLEYFDNHIIDAVSWFLQFDLLLEDLH